MEIFILAYVIIFGLLLGSFFNVVIYRIPRKQFFRNRRSICPHCGSRIRFYDNVPVVSFFILNRRCRDCRGVISWQYPMVELLTALMALLLYRLQDWPFGEEAMQAGQIIRSILILTAVPALFIIINFFRKGADGGK